MHLYDCTAMMSVLSDYQSRADKVSTDKMLLLRCYYVLVAKALQSVSSESRVPH